MWDKSWKIFLELPNGIPDSDTFRRLFERLNPKELSKYLNACLENLRKNGKKCLSFALDFEVLVKVIFNEK